MDLGLISFMLDLYRMFNMEVAKTISDPSKRVYTSQYCEENVWHLCNTVKESCSEADLERCFAVFISNDNEQVPLWHQRSSTNDQRLVIWDYHVIMVHKGQEGTEDNDSQVYDLDTELNVPCPFTEYAEACLGDETVIKQEFWRKFRVIGAKEFLRSFASDRSHMLKPDGTWMAPTPNYPPIHTKNTKNNLRSYISMEKSNSKDFGNVYSLKEFCEQFMPS